MGIIGFSLLLLIICVLGIILTFNYLVRKWEKNRISNLTSKIKQVDQDILHRGTAQRGFSKFDFSQVGKYSYKSVTGAANIYERAIIKIGHADYPKWFNTLKAELMLVRKNTLLFFRRTIKRILNLTKPIEKTDDLVHESISLSKNEEGDANINIRLQDQPKHNIFDELPDLTEVDKPNSDNRHDLDKDSKNSINNQDIATIGMVGVEEKSEQEMNLFEKLENKLIIKLKDSGMESDDIWLELGDLYLKYSENKKAMEVYAFVLKHAKDDHHKELARNKLIGL